MAMNFIQEMVNNKFLLILLEESEYLTKLEEIIKSFEAKKTKICYVCLSKPYSDVFREMKSRGINTDDFFFIDTLTSHYYPQQPSRDCIYLSSPTDLTAIRDAIGKAIKSKKCGIILLDTISTMLIYLETHSIVKFTHNLLSEKAQENVKKLFIILKGDSVPLEDVNRLTKDLEMFADRKLDMTGALE